MLPASYRFSGANYSYTVKERKECRKNLKRRPACDNILKFEVGWI
jgi:hypothetical protein